MVQRVKIDQGIVFVTADSRDAAERQAKALSRDLRRSIRLHIRLEQLPGIFALGSEAVPYARGERTLKKEKRRGKTRRTH